jgi:glycosyltransferase involved in cell wall biosynthesis
VPNGIDLERFRPVPIPSTSALRILGIGSLLRVKRWDVLLLTAQELARRGVSYQLTIAGEGALRSELERIARELGVAASVKFVGQTDDVARLLAESTMLVHTAESEGCPNAVMEAMACGRPVVAANVGDMTTLINDGETGYLVPTNDVSAFAERISRFASSRELAQRLGDAGRAKAAREFGLDGFVANTFDAYRQSGWAEV